MRVPCQTCVATIEDVVPLDLAKLGWMFTRVMMSERADKVTSFEAICPNCFERLPKKETVQ